MIALGLAFARCASFLSVVLFALMIGGSAGPASAQTPPAAEPPQATQPSGDVASAGFGDEVMLVARPALVLSGQTGWDDLYGTFRTAINTTVGIANAQGLVVAGPPQVRFVAATDDRVDYEVILPVAATPGPGDRFLPAKPGMTPSGRAFRFVHLGGYDTIDQTYDEITSFLEERSILAEDAFVEEYVRDPDTTSETELATFIYVFPKN